MWLACCFPYKGMSILGITISYPMILPISPQCSFFLKLWLEFSNYTVTLSFCVSSAFKKNAISQYITPRCRIHRWFISQNKCSETSAPNRGKTRNSYLPQNKNSPGSALLNKVCFQLYFQILLTITAWRLAPTHLILWSGSQAERRK